MGGITRASLDAQSSAADRAGAAKRIVSGTRALSVRSLVLQIVQAQ